jgi:hypothetical protein
MGNAEEANHQRLRSMGLDDAKERTLKVQAWAWAYVGAR